MGTRLQGILSRRVLRDLKSNFWRYLALLLLITLGMYMVVAMIGSAESIMWTVETSYEKNLGRTDSLEPLSLCQKRNVDRLPERG